MREMVLQLTTDFSGRIVFEIVRPKYPDRSAIIEVD
jgi:hypothetical protein